MQRRPESGTPARPAGNLTSPGPVFIAEVASDGMVSLDPENRIRTWNPGARRIFGYRRSEVQGFPLSRLLPEGSRRSMYRVLSRISHHPWIEYGEASFLRKGSAPVEVAFTALPEHSVAPDRDGVLLIFHDITARRALERDLRSRVLRYEEAEHLARLGTWEWDVSTDILVWSDEFYHLLGLEPSVRQSTFKRFVRRIRTKDRRAFMAGIRRTLREHAPFECRYGLRRADGSMVEVLSRARLLKGPGPRLRLVGTSQDLRAIKDGRPKLVRKHVRETKGLQIQNLLLARAESLLFSSFDRDDALLKGATAVVSGLADRCLIDLVEEDGSASGLQAIAAGSHAGGKPSDPGRPRRLSAFPGGARDRVRITGEFEVYRAVPSRDLAELFPPPDALELPPGSPDPSILILPLRSRKGVTGVLTLLHLESRRRFGTAEILGAQQLAQFMSMALEHCRLYSKAVQEAEHLRDQQAMVARLNQELEARAEERTSQLRGALSDMEEFARAAAHDLRAPLRGISGLVQALSEDLRDRLDPSVADLTGRIRAACRRMESLIQSLLACSRVSHVEAALEPVDSARTLEDALRQMRGDLEERRAQITTDPDLPWVMAHPDLLLQAVVNILDNATKFVAAGVRPSVRIGAELREERARLIVDDNGIGIEPEFAQRVFKPFERLNDTGAYPGSGLGLAIVRRSVERMGGSVGTEPRASGGSRFWIELPRAPRPAPSAPGTV